MDFDYTITDEFLDLVREQVWETRYGLRLYREITLHEYAHYKPYLPEKPRYVLDMCSGLGRTAIYLNHIYDSPSITFFLADRNGRTKNTGDFDPPQEEYYNDLSLAVKFCIDHGLHHFEAFDVEEADWSKLPRIDLIISTLGLGFHVPIERYIDRLMSVAAKDCTLIFGCRQEKYDAASFEHLFHESLLVPGTPRHPCPHEDWLILRRPKCVST